MPARLAFTCCLCDATAEPAPRAINPFDNEPLVPHLPDNWCVLTVACPDLVLDDRTQAVADEMGVIARTPVYSVMAAQIRSMARNFQTTLVVCGSCQVGPVFDVFQQRLRKAVDVAEDRAAKPPSPLMPPPLPPWLRPLDGGVEAPEAPSWVTAPQEEVWHAPDGSSDWVSALWAHAGCEYDVPVATTADARLYDGGWVVHFPPDGPIRICRVFSEET